MHINWQHADNGKIICLMTLNVIHYRVVCIEFKNCKSISSVEWMKYFVAHVIQSMTFYFNAIANTVSNSAEHSKCNYFCIDLMRSFNPFPSQWIGKFSIDLTCIIIRNMRTIYFYTVYFCFCRIIPLLIDRLWKKLIVVSMNSYSVSRALDAFSLSWTDICLSTD